MYKILLDASVWITLALIASFISVSLRIATSLSEIIIGGLAGLVLLLFGFNLDANDVWIKFLASTGAIILTFLAGAEIDPEVFIEKWKEATLIGFMSFLAPFIGCTLIAMLIGWAIKASLIAGVALSTTSVAVVYSVMIEFGLNKTEFGKIILAACFITDLCTVIALGLIFSPFTIKTIIFTIGSVIGFLLIYRLTPKIFKKFGSKPSEIETKFLLWILFIFAVFAVWADSEPVLPAYIIGMILAGSVGKEHLFIRRIRTLTFGFLTPFYFLRAGYLVSIPSIISAPLMLLTLLIGKMITKFLGVYPIAKIFKYENKESMYTTLLMSTGLTFGSIASLYGLTHGIINQQQYSLLIGAVIGSAVIPTIIANSFFLPR
ncbi:MAG: cation:proton antiporter, partial [bacterium]